jgi:CRISPR-associated DxTHG motif protein
MRRTHFISFLGANAYTPVRYSLGDQTSCEHRFVQAALLELLKARGQLPDRISVLLTETAFTKNWQPSDGTPGLAAALEQYPDINPVTEFPEGQSEDQLWAMFDRITGVVQPGDRLWVDVTHGFRTFPIILVVALAFLRRASDVTIEAVHYGAFEARSKNGGIAPVFEVLPLFALLEWTSQLEGLRQAGDARGLASLIEQDDSLREVAGRMRALADALACAALPEIQPRATALSEAVERLAGGGPSRTRPHNTVIQRAYDLYKGLVRTGTGDIAEDVAAKTRAAELLLDHQQYMQAFTVLREALVDLKLVYLPQIKDRKRIGENTKALGYSGVEPAFAKKFCGIEEKLNKQRNNLDHGWTDTRFESGDHLKALGRDFCAQVRSLAASRPPLPDERPKRMVVLLNHELLPKQTEAIRREGILAEDILLAPEPLRALFRAIPPEWSGEELRKRLEKPLRGMKEMLRPGDLALVQGEPGATFFIVRELQQLAVTVYHATTERVAEGDPRPGDPNAVEVRRTFRHVALREYR